MKKNQPITELLNDYADEFLTKTIPFFASNPEWRIFFNTLSNISKGERVKMLQRLENGDIPSDLVPVEQLSTAMAFLKVNLESPVGPRMMVRMIDWELDRVRKIHCDRIKEFIATKGNFNPAEFIMDAFFKRPLPGATWSDVLQSCVELSDSERTSYLELLLNAPYDVHIPGALTRLLVYNLKNPSHAEAMIQAIEESLISTLPVWTSSDGEGARVDDQALA